MENREVPSIQPLPERERVIIQVMAILSTSHSFEEFRHKALVYLLDQKRSYENERTGGNHQRP